MELFKYKQLLEDDCDSERNSYFKSSEESASSSDHDSLSKQSLAKINLVERDFVIFAGESEQIEDKNGFEMVEDSS